MLLNLLKYQKYIYKTMWQIAWNLWNIQELQELPSVQISMYYSSKHLKYLENVSFMELIGLQDIADMYVRNYQIHKLMNDFVKNTRINYSGSNFVITEIIDNWSVSSLEIKHLELFKEIYEKIAIYEKIYLNAQQWDLTETQYNDIQWVIWKFFAHFISIWDKEQLTDADTKAKVDLLFYFLKNREVLEKFEIPIQSWYLLKEDNESALQALFDIIEKVFKIYDICKIIEIRGTHEITGKNKFNKIIDILIYVHENKEVFHTQLNYLLKAHAYKKVQIEEYIGLESYYDYENFNFLKNVADVCNMLDLQVVLYKKYLESKSIVSFLEYLKILEYWRWGGDDTLLYITIKDNRNDIKFLEKLSAYAKLIYDFELKDYSKYDIMREMHPKKKK